jgi:hypothetical protein
VISVDSDSALCEESSADSHFSSSSSSACAASASASAWPPPSLRRLFARGGPYAVANGSVVSVTAAASAPQPPRNHALSSADEAAGDACADGGDDGDEIVLRLRHALRLPTFGNAPRIEYEGHSSSSSLPLSSAAAVSSKVHTNPLGRPLQQTTAASNHAALNGGSNNDSDDSSDSSSIPFGPSDWRAESRILWRIDRDEVGSTYSLVKNNLMALFVGPRGAGDLGPPATVSATAGMTVASAVASSGTVLHRSNAASAGAGGSGSAGAGPSGAGAGAGAGTAAAAGSGSATAGTGDVKRRRLIVDLLAPRFRVLSMPLGAALPAALRSDFAALNADQRRAVERVLTARDYALVLGACTLAPLRLGFCSEIL